MPPKVALTASVLAATVTTSGPSGTQSDTNIAKSSKQLVEWYREIITQFADN